jgi:hypothetical protein
LYHTSVISNILRSCEVWGGGEVRWAMLGSSFSSSNITLYWFYLDSPRFISQPFKKKNISKRNMLDSKYCMISFVIIARNNNYRWSFFFQKIILVSNEPETTSHTSPLKCSLWNKNFWIFGQFLFIFCNSLLQRFCKKRDSQSTI